MAILSAVLWKYHQATGMIKKFVEDKKINLKTDFVPWLFNKDLIPFGNTSERIRINFSSQYTVTWQYDQESGLYKVWQNNKPLQAIEGVNNLIIQYAQIKIVDQEGRRNIRLTGSGEAVICQKGICQEGGWKKESGRTRFYDQTGEEIKFLPGKTWISIVSTANRIDY